MSNANDQAPAIVFGMSGGIGAAIGRRFLRAGHPVTGTWRSRQGPIASLAEEFPGLVSDAQVDVADAERVHAAIEAAGGALRHVVFAAGAPIDQPYVSKVGDGEWQRSFNVETFGFMNVVRAAIPVLRRTRGTLTFVSSSGVRRYPKGDLLSVAPKAAAEQVIKGVAAEEGRYGIRANAVAVGVVEAGMFLRLKEAELDEAWQAAALRNIPLRKFGSGEDVANAAYFLASAEAGYITGQVLHVDGGYTV